MPMFDFALLSLLLLPAADARLRGFTPQAPETPPAVSCDHRPGSVDPEPEAGQDGFDELALLQQELTPAVGTHVKSTQEWAAHWNDHASKIGSKQRVLDNETVAGQLSKLNSGNCADDPLWRDADGDGCDIYRFAIESGKTTRELACNGGGETPPTPASKGLRGARGEVIADATAKIFCPLTCGMCQPEAHDIIADASAGVSTSTTATDFKDAPLDAVTFLQIGVSSSSGPTKKKPEFWAEHAYDHESMITPDQQILDNETVSYRLSLLQKGEGCADDPLWRDADGDGCEIYKFAIETGKGTREVVCNGGGEQRSLQQGNASEAAEVVADATAKVFCPVTCGVC